MGFTFAGKQKETTPITARGKEVGQETRTVTRFFGRGTETVTRKTAEGSSKSEYSFRQNVLTGNKSWEARSASTQKVGNGTTVQTTASAKGGDNSKIGIHASGSANSEVLKGTGKDTRFIDQATVSRRSSDL